MTTGIETKIFRALTGKLDAYTTGNAIDVAYPGRTYTPREDTPWIRPTLLWATTDAVDLSGDTNNYSGIFQVDLFWPEQRGMVRVLERASAIVAHFQRPQKLFHEGVRVEINLPPYLAPASQEPGWIQVPVSIPFRSFVRIS